jgi:uncharacterized protein YqeY
MALKEQLQNDLKAALRQGDERRKAVIRMTLAAIRNAEVDKNGPLSEEELAALLQREIKKRRETVAELERAGRAERLAEEQAELHILESYAPRLLSREEIAAEARAVIAQVHATGPAHMGEVMRQLMPRLKGRADGRLVNEVVRDLLASGSGQ